MDTSSGQAAATSQAGLGTYSPLPVGESVSPSLSAEAIALRTAKEQATQSVAATSDTASASTQPVGGEIKNPWVKVLEAQRAQIESLRKEIENLNTKRIKDLDEVHKKGQLDLQKVNGKLAQVSSLAKVEYAEKKALRKKVADLGVEIERLEDELTIAKTQIEEDQLLFSSSKFDGLIPKDALEKMRTKDQRALDSLLKLFAQNPEMEAIYSEVEDLFNAAEKQVLLEDAHIEQEHFADHPQESSIEQTTTTPKTSVDIGAAPKGEGRAILQESASITPQEQTPEALGAQTEQAESSIASLSSRYMEGKDPIAFIFSPFGTTKTDMALAEIDKLSVTYGDNAELIARVAKSSNLADLLSIYVGNEALATPLSEKTEKETLATLYFEESTRGEAATTLHDQNNQPQSLRKELSAAIKDLLPLYTMFLNKQPDGLLTLGELYTLVWEPCSTAYNAATRS